MFVKNNEKTKKSREKPPRIKGEPLLGNITLKVRNYTGHSEEYKNDVKNKISKRLKKADVLKSRKKILQEIVEDPRKVKERKAELKIIFDAIYPKKRSDVNIRDKETLKLVEKLVLVIKKENELKLKEEPFGNKKANDNLVWAGYEGDIAKALESFYDGADVIKARDIIGMNVLHNAILGGQFSFMKFAFEEGAELFREIYYQLHSGKNLMVTAFFERRRKIFYYLMDRNYMPFFGMLLERIVRGKKTIKDVEDYEDRWLEAVERKDKTFLFKTIASKEGYLIYMGKKQVKK